MRRRRRVPARPFRKIQSRGVGCVDDLNGLLGVAKPALRVGFDSAQRVIPTHASHGAHFAQRLLITTRGVRGQSSGLANDIDATRTAHSSLGMLVGGLGIEINQLTGHHQVPRNNVTVGTRQRRQRAHSITVKLLGTHASRNRRLIAVRRHVLVSRRIVLVGGIVAPLILTRPATVALKTAALTSVTAQASATVITTLEATTAAPAVITTIVTATKITALTIATLEITLTVTTIITTETAAVITTLVTASTIVKTTATIITTLIATTITPAIITATKITALTITTIITTETTTIITTLVTASTVIKATATIITTLEATTITPAIITTLEITLTITTLVTATIIVAFPPLGLTLRVITTAESAASLSLFCHGA